MQTQPHAKPHFIRCDRSGKHLSGEATPMNYERVKSQPMHFIEDASDSRYGSYNYGLNLLEIDRSPGCVYSILKTLESFSSSKEDCLIMGGSMCHKSGLYSVHDKLLSTIEDCFTAGSHLC